MLQFSLWRPFWFSDMVMYASAYMSQEKSAEFLRKNMKISVLVEISLKLKYDKDYS